MTAKLTVHFRTTDTATGRPTPARIRISDANGKVYPPLGRFAEVATGPHECLGSGLRLNRQSSWPIDGNVEIQLPPSVPLRIQIEKGPLYRPIDQEIMLGTGQIALRFPLERCTHFDHLNRNDWLAVDFRAHDLSPFDAALEAAAEGLDAVQLLARPVWTPCQNGHTMPGVTNLAAFSGPEPTLEKYNCRVFVNSFNSHPILGTVSLLDCHRPVFPFQFGGDDATDDWSILSWCEQCHRKRGLTVWANSHADWPGGEALAALILGEIDAIEYPTSPSKKPFFPWYYALLNAGLRPTLVAGSGKQSNAQLLGQPRTYIQLKADDGTHAHWVDAVRSGRTFVTNGPMLQFDIAGQGPGSRLGPKLGTTLPLRASAASFRPFERLELIANGEVVQSVDARPEGHATRAELGVDWKAESACWLAVRATGTGSELGNMAMAHSSPIELVPEGVIDTPNPARFTPILTILRQTTEWIRTHGRFEQEKNRDRLLGVLERAEATLTGLSAP